VVEAENVGKSYGDKKILEGIDLLVERGSKTAFVGQNGQGKSTLAKIIVNELDYTGSLKLGHNVELGYFAQNQAEYLDGELSIHETMINAANEKTRSKVRDMLGSFLFRGDDVDKKVKVLSGGERNRLALCKLLLQPINVLVMDEPTNHLDIKSKNVLKSALENFEGTLLLVSHDRDFLQGLTNKVYEFKDRVIKEYLGDIDYYLEERKVADLREIEKTEKKSTPKKKNSQPASYENEKKVKSLQNKVSNTESKISKLENEIEKLDEKLVSNYEETIAESNFLDKYEKKKKDLQVQMELWETLQEEIEQLV